MSRVAWWVLLFCSAMAFAQDAPIAQGTPIALTGTLITPDGIVPHGTVLIENGKIAAAGAQVSLPARVKSIDTHGIIAPGLIDLHNHLTWNVFPRWKPMEEFGNRYDWQQKPIYKVLMDAPHHALVAEGLECEMEWFAEVKAVSEGETSVVGGTKADCGKRLARNLDRNLDYDPRLGKTGAGPVVYDVFPFQMTAEEAKSANDALNAHGALLIHVAEGAPGDASAAREFAMLKSRGLLRKGVSVIHGVALKPEDFGEMASAGVGFIWSPRSNLELYGGTADVAAAKAAHVHMALAPDWSPTGSDGSLAELQYAAVWNAAQAHPIFSDRELVEMATSGAAALVGLEDSIGSVAPGYAADVIVLRSHGTDAGKDAYWSMVHSSAEDVELVLIGGGAVYGDAALTSQFGGHPMDRVEICGAEKSVVPPSLADRSANLRTLEAGLDGALREWGRRLAPVAECGQ